MSTCARNLPQHFNGCVCTADASMTAEVTDVDLVPAIRCSCAHHADGSTTTSLCPVHADADPCLRMSQVTGRRRVGSIKNGTCTACGWAAPDFEITTDPSLADTSAFARAEQPDFPRNADDSIDAAEAIKQGYVSGFLLNRSEEPYTRTLVGHWDGNTIVVEYMYDGDVQDDRPETGYWSEGLWASSATGHSDAEIAAGMLDEYEESHRIRVAQGEDDETPDETCAADDCDDDLSDGEGYDGYCGTHADLIEAHESGAHECACAMSESSLNACPLHGPGGSADTCPEC